MGWEYGDSVGYAVLSHGWRRVAAAVGLGPERLHNSLMPLVMDNRVNTGSSSAPGGFGVNSTKSAQKSYE